MYTASDDDDVLGAVCCVCVCVQYCSTAAKGTREKDRKCLVYIKGGGGGGGVGLINRVVVVVCKERS